MTINARCVVGGIGVTFERLGDENDGDNSVENPDDLKYKYELKYSYDSEILVTPDVPLMPHGGDQKEFTANVARVPYGQAIPQQSWTGLCLCALLGSKRKRAFVFILGIKPGLLEYERIGVAAGANPAAFAQAQRQSVVIT